MDVSSRIKSLREKKGLTVNGLAIKSGISQSFLREIELGNKKPTVETLSVLCDTLDISLKDFFDYDNGIKHMDELDEAIFRLDKEQRKKLASFLKSMQL
ncbi:MAG: helix-turn-helix domain-containing protein [Eubacteriales bacterium]